MEPLNSIIKVQKGFSIEGKKPLDTLLKEVKEKPYRTMALVLDHFVHNLCLIDYKGIKFYQSISETEGQVFNSLLNIL
jgi:hypothetical protein